MSKVTHLVNFGFGELAVQKVASYFHVIKSADPAMPVGTEFPIKDTITLDADVIQLNAE
ncbi:hypothetical protein OFDDKENP_00058 [Aeromonas phage B614]|uniref:Uncharacterized protein n=1 Tax=Aeromonas phage vB_AehM_DM2 TaxID=2973716 RepID=A0AA94YJM1_9CAUD|nr:hypothetical protein OFDDKENP_00058 [Aeromonas phage B614]UYD58216.1 hypothetical protein JNEOFJEA_00119 [Aeromonas phage UP87]UYD58579.1 hypothetical protein IPAKJDPM_00236 [Aeromonas phage avDM14-QBC]UYD58793.1 hypothetical protein HNNIDBEH_00200 [Aeromonas phage avDM10-HWA]UYD58903.1 hypothetical protein OFOPOMKI_00053 [Aeromonas phage avDM7-IJDJ]UYD59665.1 hypothetical protein JNMOADIG_00136 [Aeromonas phage avDM5]UYD59962.1 hypothetical protein LEHPIFIF_00206 [Aeromonas phage avDM9-HA